MKKVQRILALVGAVTLILLYASTLIFAFMDSEYATQLLAASVAGTILLPVLIYGLTVFIKLSKKESDDSSNE